MTIISGDRETTFNFDHSSQVVTIKTGVAITTDETAIYGDTLYTDVVIDNYGILNGSASCIYLSGDNSSVFNFAGASISGRGGIAFNGVHAILQNYGMITAEYNTVSLNGSSNQIDNYGTITGGQAGFYIQGGTYNTEIRNFGTISSDTAILGYGEFSLQNSGLITGGIYAPDPINYSIVNTGKIQGSVDFGGADDLYDGRHGGSVTGLVSGEGGADTLRGGADEETFSGGFGADLLSGGGGADVFVYSKAGDSTRNATDLIRHWDGADEFDLSEIDANTHVNTSST